MSMTGESHTSLFPLYFPDKLRSRTLARWEDYNIITEYGEYIKIDSYEQLKFVLVDQSIECYVNGVYDDKYGFPYLHNCLHDNLAGVHSSATGGIVSISFKVKGKGRKTGTIAFASSWGVLSTSQGLILSLRRLFDKYGCGDHPSPGSLGERGLVLKMKTQHKRFHRPNHMMRTFVLKHTPGGRSDDPIDTNHIYKMAYEEDRNSGYPAESKEVIDPGEPCIRILNDLHRYEKNIFTYIVECEVDATQALTKFKRQKFGPLPLRENKIVQYPTSGKWSGVYWKEEIEIARENGYIITTKNGYGFPKSSDFMKEWAEDLYTLIHELKDSQEESTKIIDHISGGMAKFVPLAAIGRQGRKPEKIIIVPEEEKQIGDKPIMDYFSSVPVSDEWFIHVIPDKDMNALSQIYAYIIMKMRLALYKRMLEHLEYGNTIITTNYDAIYLTQPSQLDLGKGLGEWKQKCLHNAQFPKCRHLISDEKVTTPGVHQSDRPQNLLIAQS